MMKEKQVAAAAASLIQVIGWVSNVGFLVAIVGGIIGINSTYRFGSFVFSTGMCIIYLIATPGGPSRDAESKLLDAPNGNKRE